MPGIPGAAVLVQAGMVQADFGAIAGNTCFGKKEFFMQDLVIELRYDGSHLYEQIYQHIREEIRTGRLPYQEKLPSTRYLAAYLQVSRATVELAYEQLLSEGYIESVPYKGYYVAQVEELYRIDGSKEKHKPESALRTNTCAFDFSPNAIDMRVFPFETWRKITKNTLSQDKSETFSLGEPKGDLALRETIARYLHASRGVNCSAEQIIVGAGNDYLLTLLGYILGKDSVIAFENPTYPRAWKILGLLAKKLLTVSADENGISVEELKKTDANAVYVMPSHQYPRGVVMPIGRRMELLNWASHATDRYIIEDDYDSEFRYRGKPIPSLQASDQAGKVVYIGTVSKSIAPAIRVSYMVLPKQLLRRYEEKYSFFSSTVSRIDQTILNEFIRDGAFERHLNRMRKLYKEKHEMLLEQLKEFQKDFVLSGENAGLHILLTDRQGRTEEELIAAAAAAGVRVYGMKGALVQPLSLEQEKAWKATILLGFGGLTQEEIVKGISLLRKAWGI